MNTVSGNTDTGTIPIPDVPMQEIVLPIDELTARATEKLNAEFYEGDTKIHRFPRDLRGIGGDNDRYIVPSVVAIGPYHHGSQHLQEMEEVKLAAAHYVCIGSGHSPAEVCDKMMFTAVGAARGCYDADDPSVAELSDAEFAAMMFLDGCFLLQYIAGGGDQPVLKNRMTLSKGPSIERDIFLLENQIPWLVLETLMEFMAVDVRGFLVRMQDKFRPGEGKEKVPDESGGPPRRGVNAGAGDEYGGGGYKPPHLLGLHWFTQVGAMPAHMIRSYTGFVSTLKSSSAGELAEIGVTLTPSTKPWFGDMAVRRRLLFGEMSLSPVFLNDITACWLVNIAAMEATTSTSRPIFDHSDDGYTVSSYLSMLAMLMDREDDVQQMRAKHLLYSTFSDEQALRFFKGLAQHLRLGNRYYDTLAEIHSYKHNRSVRIFAHKFVYNNYRAIAAVLSVVGVLVSILKALYSLKKPGA